jgi:hypothetical protein
MLEEGVDGVVLAVNLTIIGGLCLLIGLIAALVSKLRLQCARCCVADRMVRLVQSYWRDALPASNE